MTNKISSSSGTNNRPRLCRSEHQPNILEYIDTTLNDLFASNFKLQSSTTTTLISNGCDQFGNTIVDQYLLYILCQKLNPNRIDHRTENIFHALHQLLIKNGKISKSFFEYTPASVQRSNYQTLFYNYTNFIWNEFDIDVLLELACFLLKYRLNDIFTSISNSRTSSNGIRQKEIGYFIEIIAIYYLFTNHHDFFISSRSTNMLFPYPNSISNSNNFQNENDASTFSKFLRHIHDNGEITFDIRQIKLILQSDSYQFLNKKLENKKISFINFLQKILHNQQEYACRSLKSLCRLKIKMNITQYPTDIKHLSSYPSINDQLLTFLTYDNKYALESSQ